MSETMGIAERLRERVESPFERPAVDQSLMREAADRIEALERALKPFAAERLPSTKPSVIDYNQHGLRCLMSPMEVAQVRARSAIGSDTGDKP